MPTGVVDYTNVPHGITIGLTQPRAEVVQSN